MRLKIFALIVALGLMTPAFCQTIGTVDYQAVIANYAKAKTAYTEIDDRASALQTYLLEKEKEFKKIDSPIAKKAFEEKITKEFQMKQEALAKLKAQKEKEVGDSIDKVIKAVALENKIDIVIDYRIVYFGGVDITDKVIKKLNTPSATPAGK